MLVEVFMLYDEFKGMPVEVELMEEHKDGMVRSLSTVIPKFKSHIDAQRYAARHHLFKVRVVPYGKQ